MNSRPRPWVQMPVARVGSRQDPLSSSAWRRLALASGVANLVLVALLVLRAWEYYGELMQ